uniref:Sister chromatid cohesion protein DCC1 n=1 Tax=Timema californicum TaxID=61474 RepID=A0A7R9PBX9_TIMCA|nr:unnamed protein product [Timema californicum]
MPGMEQGTPSSVGLHTFYSGMKTSLQHLSGIALMDTSCKPEVIWYFDEMELPEDLKERFRVLFQTREKWTLDEIRPYVQ